MPNLDSEWFDNMASSQQEVWKTIVNDFFNTHSKAVASSMAADYLRKKNAWQAKNTRLRQTGSLDLARLYAYKTSDEIFRSTSATKKGKNHGVYMVVDWSGSMSGHTIKMAQQAMIVARFCKTVGIPFAVDIFTSGGDFNSAPKSADEMVLNSLHQRRVMDSSMTWAEIQISFNYMSTTSSPNFADPYGLKSDFGMGGTPLEASMIYTYVQATNMKREFKLDNMTIIAITDGDGSRRLTNQKHEHVSSIIDPFTGSRYNVQGNFVQSAINRMIRSSGMKIFNIFMGSHASAGRSYSIANDERFTKSVHSDLMDEDSSRQIKSIKDLAYFNSVIFAPPSSFFVEGMERAVSRRNDDDDDVIPEYVLPSVSDMKKLLKANTKWKTKANIIGSFIVDNITQEWA